MQKFIVDGYNVIHARPGFDGRGPMDAERNRLIGEITEYVRRRRVRVTLVFDGAGHLSDAEAPVPGRLQIVYSAAGETADALIVATLEAAPNPREFIVVTSDRADIGRATSAMGAQVMDSAAFLERMERATREAPEQADETEDTEEPVDVDYWMDEFRRRRND